MLDWKLSTFLVFRVDIYREEMKIWKVEVQSRDFMKYDAIFQFDLDMIKFHALELFVDSTWDKDFPFSYSWEYFLLFFILLL